MTGRTRTNRLRIVGMARIADPSVSREYTAHGFVPASDVGSGTGLIHDPDERAKGGFSMAKTVKPVPEGYHTVTPYLVQNDTKRALEFYTKAFGAETKTSMPGPGGRIMHAEIKIGDSMIFM